MDAWHILLHWFWQFDRQVLHNGKLNNQLDESGFTTRASFDHEFKEVGLVFTVFGVGEAGVLVVAQVRMHKQCIPWLSHS